MHVLVLDTVHGGKEIGSAYREDGHTVDEVDVYNNTTPDELQRAYHHAYDLIVAPVHLDPDHLLISRRRVPVISHHEAVRQLIGGNLPHPLVEITGAQGKTTTAHALAHILLGKGVLHTSTGTYTYPAKNLLWKKSITPASLIPAARYAGRMHGWLVAEISLGVTGAGDLAIITSPDNYMFASGKKCAIKEKVASAKHARCVLVAEQIYTDMENVIHVEELACCKGSECTVGMEGMEFVLRNPLFTLPPYRGPLMLAAAAAMILHVNPTPLNHFTALPGRMSLSREKEIIVVDNANSGANTETTLCAARYARHCAGTTDLTLVIGQVEGDGAVCEGFSFEQILLAMDKVQPLRVVLVGRYPDEGSEMFRAFSGRIDDVCATLEEGRAAALRMTKKGSVVLSVKTWR